MNRNRYIIDPQQEPPAWRLVSGILVFVAALVIAALLSIDDIDTRVRHRCGLHQSMEELCNDAP